MPAPSKAESPLKALPGLGQSVWLDFLQRGILRSGQLKTMTERWAVSGVTSNPAIFEKAIAGSPDYEERIVELAGAGKNAGDIYETLVLEDIGDAADILRPLYEDSDARDGFVSLEVSPHLVDDTAGTIAEARRFWQLLRRPNVMIKVPATENGIPAIRHLIADGINVNVTLLFSVERYRRVIDAYTLGLEDAARNGRPLSSCASVASFFLSRIDTMIDALLDGIIEARGLPAKEAEDLKGEIAIASARHAYAVFRAALQTDRVRRLVAIGARPQRLLWASTSTKNPAYSDVKYVEPLIGPDTVTTLPLDTLRAYDDHGSPALRLTEDSARASEKLRMLQRIGIDLRAATQQLLLEGIVKFAEPFDKLHRNLDEARDRALAERKGVLK